MRTWWSTLAVLVLALILAGPALAGAKIQINDEASLDVGGTLQYLAINTDKDKDGDGEWDSYQEYKVRRARLKATAVINPNFSGVIQTEIGRPDGDGGRDMRIIESYVVCTYDNWVQLYVGQHYAPGSRQVLTSSSSMLAIDRPGQVSRNLTWGCRSQTGFNNYTFSDFASGFSAPDASRDMGMTFFGTGDLSEQAHIKYYLGTYNGLQASGSDEERYVGRVQLNLFDAEDGYTNKSYYLGKLKTVALGLTYDTQKQVASVMKSAADSSMVYADYVHLAADLFAELPLEAGVATFEAGYQMLDFDDAYSLEHVQGAGMFAQAGFLVQKTFQPWVLYETWTSDADNDYGSYTSIRAGLTYFFKGNNANVKLGFENFKSEQNFKGKDEDAVNTIILGLFTSF